MSNRLAKSIVATLGTFALSCGLMSLTAPTARAADVAVTVNCDSDVEFYATEDQDTITFTFGPNCSSGDNLGNNSGFATLEGENLVYAENGFLEYVGFDPSGTGRLWNDYNGISETPDDWWIYYTAKWVKTNLLGTRTHDGETRELTAGDVVGVIFLNEGEIGDFKVFWCGRPGTENPDCGSGTDSDSSRQLTNRQDYPTPTWICAAGVATPMGPADVTWTRVGSNPDTWVAKLSKGVYRDGSRSFTTQAPTGTCPAATFILPNTGASAGSAEGALGLVTLCLGVAVIARLLRS